MKCSKAKGFELFSRIAVFILAPKVTRQMALMKQEWFIPVGCLCLAAAILSDRFLMIQAPVLDFLVGVLTGIAIVLNLAGLYTLRKSKE